YKDSIKTKLVEAAEKKAKSDTENSILNLVVDDAGIEIPQVMIEDRIDYLLKDFGMRLKYQGFDMESYLKMTNLKAEDIRKDFADRACNDVKGRLVIEEICKVEAIEPTEEEFEEAIIKVAVQYGQKVEEFKQHLRDEDIEYIKNDSKYKKTIDFIVDNAKIN
ncbi:MAG TPA: trigger factor, partial [Clostridia bacterium]|nr:trigger factor [Clostridia bacterium]